MSNQLPVQATFLYRFLDILILLKVYIKHMPAVAVPRLSLSATGKVVYTLKTPYRDGTTQVAFDPVDFIARLAALVPKPRVNLTRYHDVLAPNHRRRGLVTPAKRGKGAMRPVDSDVVSSIQRHAAMT